MQQFLQLKHLAKLTPVSLKAVYDSNMRFLKQYRYMFGMTGTLGGQQEKSFLKSLYKTDFFNIPRFRQRAFEELPAVVVDGESMQRDPSMTGTGSGFGEGAVVATGSNANDAGNSKGGNSKTSVTSSSPFYGVALPLQERTWVTSVVEDLLFTLHPFASQLLKRVSRFPQQLENADRRARTLANRAKHLGQQLESSTKKKAIKLGEKIKTSFERLNQWITTEVKKLTGNVEEKDEDRVEREVKELKNWRGRLSSVKKDGAEGYTLSEFFGSFVVGSNGSLVEDNVLLSNIQSLLSTPRYRDWAKGSGDGSDDLSDYSPALDDADLFDDEQLMRGTSGPLLRLVGWLRYQLRKEQTEAQLEAKLLIEGKKKDANVAKGVVREKDALKTSREATTKPKVHDGSRTLPDLFRDILVNQLNFRSDIGHLVIQGVTGIGSNQNPVSMDISTGTATKLVVSSSKPDENNLSQDKYRYLRAISGEHVARLREREKLEWLYSALRGIVEHSKLRKGDIQKMRQVVEKANFVSDLATNFRSPRTTAKDGIPNWVFDTFDTVTDRSKDKASSDAPSKHVGDLRRGALIICDSVKEVQVLYTVLRNHPELKKVLGPSPKIYKWDRENDERPVKTIEPGTILIATNIGGRGLDLSVSEELKWNRGMHVIVQYLPTNERVSQQAFGRTARCGNPGTGRYVIDWRRQEAVAGEITRVHGEEWAQVKKLRG